MPPIRLMFASTTMGIFAAPVMVKPKRFVLTPKLAWLVSIFGFQIAVGRPPNVAPHPVVPGR